MQPYRYGPSDYPSPGYEGSLSLFQVIREDGILEFLPTLQAADDRAAALIIAGVAVAAVGLPPRDIEESVILRAPGVVYRASFGPGTTRIVGAAATGIRVTVSALAVDLILSGLEFLMPTDALPAVDNLSSQLTLEECCFIGGGGVVSTGVRNDTAGASLDLRAIKYLGGSGGFLLSQGHATAGTHAEDLSVESGTLDTAIFVDAGFLFAEGVHVDDGATPPTLTDVFHLGAVSGYAVNIAVMSPNITNGLHITSDALSFEIESILFPENLAIHILVDPGLTGLDGGTPSSLHIASGHLSSLYGLDAPSLWLANADFISTTIDPEGSEPTFRAIGAEFAVGSPWQGAETALGGGDSHTQGMRVLRSEDLELGPWDEITTDVRTINGVSADLFSVLTVGASVYFGSRWLLPGLKFLFTTLGDNLHAYNGAPNAIFEVWTGAAWVEAQGLGTKADSPYTTYGASISNALGGEHLRLGDAWESQALKTVNGVADLYWIRVRVLTLLVASPAIEQVKLHTSRTEINADGVIEFFGEAHPAGGPIPGWSRESLGVIVASAPGNLNIDVSANIVIAAVRNRFKANTSDTVAGSFDLPDWVDTAHPLTLSIRFWQVAAGAGDFVWVVTAARLRDGDLADGTAVEVSTTGTQAVPGVVDEVFTFEATIDLNALGLVTHPDAIFISFERTGGAVPDTAPDIAMIQTDLTAYRWRI